MQPVIGCFIFAAALLLPYNLSSAKRVFRCGIVRAPRICELRNGRPAGFAVDLLRLWSSTAGIELHLVCGSYSNILKALQNGALDGAANFPYNRDLAREYAYSALPLYTDWSQQYCRPGASVISFDNLQHRRIGILSRNPDARRIRELLPHSKIMEFSGFDKLSRALINGTIDSAVASRLYRYRLPPELRGASESGEQLLPHSFYFITSRQNRDSILTRLDYWLRTRQSDPKSEYYRMKSRWLPPQGSGKVPSWVFHLTAGGILLILVLGWLLYRQHSQTGRSRFLFRETEEKLNRFLANSSLGILILELRGGDSFYLAGSNPRAEELLGTGLCNSLGKPLLELFPKLASSGLIEKYLNIARHGDQLQQDFMVMERESVDRAFEIHAFQLARRIVVVQFHDITERKQQELDYKQLISELQDKNTEMEQFTYTVSHDLRSPIITIKGFLEVLHRDILLNRTDRIESHFERLFHAADTMKSLLDGLLQLSRIGRMVNPPEFFDTGELVHSVLELLHGPISELGMRVSVAEPLPQMYADRQRMLEVFQNLIENSCKFSRESPSPQIRISAETASGQTVYCISDNGCGIPEEYREKVFNLFDQLQRDKGGAGVGLSLVRKIISLHKGRIWIEDNPDGVGTAIKFTLWEETGSETKNSTVG